MVVLQTVQSFHGFLISRVCFNESDDRSEAFAFRATPVCILTCASSGDFILLVEGLLQKDTENRF